MRFKHNPKPKTRDSKQKVKFLLFPKRIDNETRWLEFAKIEYRYLSYCTYDDYGPEYDQKWFAVEWLPYDPVKDCNDV